jgi:hypothetical protein
MEASEKGFKAVRLREVALMTIAPLAPLPKTLASSSSISADLEAPIRTRR